MDCLPPGQVCKQQCGNPPCWVLMQGGGIDCQTWLHCGHFWQSLARQVVPSSKRGQCENNGDRPAPCWLQTKTFQEPTMMQTTTSHLAQECRAVPFVTSACAVIVTIAQPVRRYASGGVGARRRCRVSLASHLLPLLAWKLSCNVICGLSDWQ